MDMLPVQNMQKSKMFDSSALIFSEVHRCLPLIGIIQKLQKRRFYLFFFFNSSKFCDIFIPDCSIVSDSPWKITERETCCRAGRTSPAFTVNPGI